MIYFLIAANLVMGGFFIWRYPTLPPQFPLFYSRPTGEDQIADFWLIFLLPFLMNMFFVINNYLSKRLFPNNNFITPLIKIINGFLILGFSLIFFKIILLIS